MVCTIEYVCVPMCVCIYNIIMYVCNYVGICLFLCMRKNMYVIMYYSMICLCRRLILNDQHQCRPKGLLEKYQHNVELYLQCMNGCKWYSRVWMSMKQSPLPTASH